METELSAKKAAVGHFTVRLSAGQIAPQMVGQEVIGRIPGFRPGKVPANLVRKTFGGELPDGIDATIKEGVENLIANSELRGAMMPATSLEGDVNLRVQVEVVPDIPAPSIDDLVLVRMTATEPGRSEEFERLSKLHLRRQVLDQLAARHPFSVPHRMVEAEFRQIIKYLTEEAENEPNPALAKAQLTRDQAELLLIAERRVRLGLLLSAIGQAHGLEVTEEEMDELVTTTAQSLPKEGRDRFVRYVTETPMAAAQLRAPYYEGKVVDFLIDRATVENIPGSLEALEAALKDDGNLLIESVEAATLNNTLATPDQEKQALFDLALSSEAIAPEIAEEEARFRSETVELLGGERVLGSRVESQESLIDAVAKGFPVGVLAALRDAGWPAKAIEKIVAPKRTLARRRSTAKRLSPAESDAAYRMASALAFGSNVLNGRKAALAWMMRPKAALLGRTPVELLDSSIGTNYVISLLRRMDWGDLA